MNIHKIFGAPGCGKTTRLMTILEQELKEHDPNKIAFVSFTKKGTYEGANRAQEKFGYKKDDLPYFRTLHSIAFSEGGYTKHDIIQKRHYLDFSKAMGMSFTGYYTEDFYGDDDRYLFLTFLERNNEHAAQSFPYDLDMIKLRNIRHNYARFKQFKNIVDFTDIIEVFIKNGKSLPVEIAIIDEAQDLTTLQWKMCMLAFKDCKKIYVAGDDDQAIYEWSGADIDYFLNIPGEQEILQQSYRLQKKILTLSKRISALITKRVEKEFNPINDEGTITFHNSVSEIEINSTESYYFLARNNYFLFKHREFLRQHAQVFYDKDKASIHKGEIEAINLFEKSRKQNLNPTESIHVQRYLRDNAMGKQYPWFDNLDFDNDKIAYYKDLIKFKTDLSNIRITVNTIHGVKGGEADNVVLMLDITQAVKLNLDKNPNSELRCLYVACTRAKKNLHIVHSNSKNGYDSVVPWKG